MKCAARLPLTFATGFSPLPGHGDSRNMAARIDSEESGGKRTLYRFPGDAPEALAHLFTPHWRGIHDEDGRLPVAINLTLVYRYAIDYLLYSMSH